MPKKLICTHCKKPLHDKLIAFDGKKYCMECREIAHMKYNENLKLWDKKRGTIMNLFNNAGLKNGDRVIYISQLMLGFGYRSVYGTVKLNKHGWPIIVLDEKQYTKNGLRKKISWSPEFKKLYENQPQEKIA